MALSHTSNIQSGQNFHPVLAEAFHAISCLTLFSFCTLYPQRFQHRNLHHSICSIYCCEQHASLRNVHLTIIWTLMFLEVCHRFVCFLNTLHSGYCDRESDSKNP